MKKVNLDYVESCSGSRGAYERASSQAFDRMGQIPSGTRWEGRFGNQVSPKGTLVGQSRCEDCSRNVRVTYNLPMIDAWDTEGDSVKLFDSLGGTETIQVSGHQCRRERE